MQKLACVEGDTGAVVVVVVEVVIVVVLVEGEEVDRQ